MTIQNRALDALKLEIVANIGMANPAIKVVTRYPVASRIPAPQDKQDIASILKEGGDFKFIEADHQQALKTLSAAVLSVVNRNNRYGVSYIPTLWVNDSGTAEILIKFATNGDRFLTDSGMEVRPTRNANEVMDPIFKALSRELANEMTRPAGLGPSAAGVGKA
jgi:hypothetical protein